MLKRLRMSKITTRLLHFGINEALRSIYYIVYFSINFDFFQKRGKLKYQTHFLSKKVLDRDKLYLYIQLSVIDC